MMDSYDLAEERSVVARATERWLQFILPRQRLDGSDLDGGFEDGNTGWCDGREAAYMFGRLGGAMAWICSGEVAADKSAVRLAMQRAAHFVVNRQRADGCLDLGGQFSPNEAGFPLPGMVESYLQLKVVDPDLFESVKPDIEKYVQRAAEAVVNGSAYTANHRWTAASAPLAAAYKLFPDPRYLKKIDQYLADGIDCDDAGLWYEERSPNYNIVANAGMIYLADALNRPELLDPVIRNLKFSLLTMQPNGEVDSSFSHRQDRAQPGRAAAQFGQARRVAQLTQDGRFTTLARSLWPVGERPLFFELTPIQLEIDRHPQLLPPAQPLPDDYEMQDVPQNIARIRRGQTALTLTADRGGHFYSDIRDRWGGTRLSEDWFHLQHGDVVIQSVQLSPAGMFGIQPTELHRQSTGDYKLHGAVDGWTHTLHFRPGAAKLHMPSNLAFEIESSWKTPQSIQLRIKARTPQVLVANLTFWIRAGAVVSESMKTTAAAGQIQMLGGGGSLSVVSPGNTSSITISGLPVAAHRYSIHPQPPIPSGIKEHCAAYSLGLRFPIDLNLVFDLG